MSESYSRNYVCTSNDTSKYLPILVHLKPEKAYEFLKPIILKKYSDCICNDQYFDIHVQDGKFEYSFVFTPNEKQQTEIDIGVFHPSIFKRKLKHQTLNRLVEEYTLELKDFLVNEEGQQ